jgi:hypothetical protein
VSAAFARTAGESNGTSRPSRDTGALHDARAGLVTGGAKGASHRPMESKRVSSIPTLPRRQARTEAIKRAKTQRVLVVDPTKPSIIRVTAATMPRIITTQPAIKPSPMPIALEEEDDLRPTPEIVGTRSRSGAHPGPHADREGPRPRDGEATPAAITERSTEKVPQRTFGTPIFAGVTCVALTVLAVRSVHTASSMATPTALARTAVASPAIVAPPVATDVRTETSAIATSSQPSRDSQPGPSAHPRPTIEPPLRVARTVPPSPAPSGSACLRRCHGSADCVLRCVDHGPHVSPSDLHIVSPVRDAPTPEEVRLALARLGGEVSECSNGTLTGLATVDVTFANTGQVNTAVVRLPFAGTPIGSCIARVVRSARIPTFDRRLLHVAYSYRVH